MDKIRFWYRNPSKSEIICRCGGDEKTKQKTGVERILLCCVYVYRPRMDVGFEGYDLELEHL